ncbi:ornithine racemase Orr [Acidaminobacter sp.]|uniref:ornithine racemase Orr n=1 Tax=Acidaminobacter sp. TaxID=1872102 RepID=UPI00137EE153|nr:ornithine racemase Orr [Acidaminobacter sp.]MDK9712388.1 ornithine racemase Orr [Acidaminobacter sp.]MZQ97554.1 alanine/ornithine racemase family PLP-dependent enzyme [Acidaminobacter sp.]
MYPRLKIDIEKIKHNAEILRTLCVDNGIEPMVVTKVHCAHPGITRAMIEAGYTMLADSRIENLKALKNIAPDVKRVLLRLPMLSEIDEVIEFADLSLNSESETLKALSSAAKEKNKQHEIIIMVDLGDLREGVLPEDLEDLVQQVIEMSNLDLVGLGVNLTCYGGVIPDDNNLGRLVELAKNIEMQFNLKLKYISGGNSSSLYKLINKSLPKDITNLRLGEAVILGRETAYGEKIDNTHDDGFLLETQIIELKEKDSLPTGQIGMDAFGSTPTFTDRGKMRRAIVAIGRQDVRVEGLTPVDSNIEIIGASSDHLILDVTQSQAELKVGDVVGFGVDYGALLSLMTSKYVEKI